MAKTDGTRRIIVTGKVIILIGITLGVMTWVIVFNVPQL